MLFRVVHACAELNEGDSTTGRYHPKVIIVIPDDRAFDIVGAVILGGTEANIGCLQTQFRQLLKKDPAASREIVPIFLHHPDGFLQIPQLHLNLHPTTALEMA